jgi:hypothetical protein
MGVKIYKSYLRGIEKTEAEIFGDDTELVGSFREAWELNKELIRNTSTALIRYEIFLQYCIGTIK